MDNRVIRKVTLSSPLSPVSVVSAESPCLHPYPLFQWYPQSNEILLNLSLKCWKSAFNAQGSRLSIVAVQVGAVEIYVTAVDAIRWKERQGETQFTTKIGGKTSLGPSCFVC
jgi:hypothetical protein